MKSILFSGLLIGSFLLVGCGKKTVNEGYYFQNFDDIKCWTNDQPTLSNTNRHSGDWSSKMDAEHEYSQTFAIDARRLKEFGYKRVKVSAWGYITDTQAKTALIITVDAPEKTVDYSSSPFVEFVKGPKTWGKITGRLNIPDLQGKPAVLKIFAWASNKKESYIDDVEIQFEK